MPGATLTPDLFYVVESDVDGLLIARPAGLVKVTKEVGPLRLRGRFVDGGGKVETRVYSGKHIYVVDAAGTGTCDLLHIPFGFKVESDITSRTVPVNDGTGPRPPPGPPVPDPIPDPKPNPKPTPVPGGKLFVVVIQDRLNAEPDHAQALASKVFRDNLTANGHELDLIDTGTDHGRQRAEAYRPFMAAANVQPPALVLMDATPANRGKVLSVVSLPRSGADLNAAIRSITGK